MTNAIVGKSDHLIEYLDEAFAKADKIRIIVSFFMESGTKLITPLLKDALNRGAEVQIITGTYMSITEPSAIYYLFDKLGDNLNIRFYSDRFL
ncbi:hypothetical protein [Desulfitibacter alkalitolerans]|uniref:hypothetical protein n=1 Tax=Desulfitibacter alkalitolerans TaxID=264641 RepID=UPI000487B799|nr:hypothetical protein [Desulfitibacter alkalitolerans]